MFTDETSDDYAPITVVGRIAIYATELLIALHLLWVLIFTIYAATGSSTLTQVMGYFPELVVEKFQIWRMATYAFVDPPSLGIAVSIVLLWFFGREVERFYGRQKFLISYLALMIVPAAIGLIPGLNLGLAGPTNIHYGIFIMFASTYPSAMMLFNIQARWWAIGGIVISTLIFLSNRAWEHLLLLAIISLLGYGLTRYFGRGDWLPEKLRGLLPDFRKPKFTVVRSEPVPSKAEPGEHSISSIDAILDKIAQSGMASLSKKELKALQDASGELQKKDHS